MTSYIVWFCHQELQGHTSISACRTTRPMMPSVSRPFGQLVRVWLGASRQHRLQGHFPGDASVQGLAMEPETSANPRLTFAQTAAVQLVKETHNNCAHAHLAQDETHWARSVTACLLAPADGVQSRSRAPGRLFAVAPTCRTYTETQTFTALSSRV